MFDKLFSWGIDLISKVVDMLPNFSESFPTQGFSEAKKIISCAIYFLPYKALCSIIIFLIAVTKWRLIVRVIVRIYELLPFKFT